MILRRDLPPDAVIHESRRSCERPDVCVVCGATLWTDERTGEAFRPFTGDCVAVWTCTCPLRDRLFGVTEPGPVTCWSGT